MNTQNKVFKINGKVIPELEEAYHTFVLGKNWNQLLEALSDKEEAKLKTYLYPCPYGNDDCPSCKPKQEECEKCLEFKKSGTIEMHCHCWNFAKVGGTDVEVCVDCYKRKDYQTPKQSISLKEDSAEMVYEYLRASGITFNTIDSREIADKILKLIQSHLLKEVKKVRENYVMYEIEHYEEDIIKIINNLK